MSPIKRLMYLWTAHLSVALGFIGLFLPLVPTTPFLLMAASLYLRGSKRWYSWLMNHPLFGRILYDYLIHRSVQLKHKVIAWVMIWIGIGSSIAWSQNGWIQLLLAMIGSAVSLHIYLLKTRVKEIRLPNSTQTSLPRE